MAQNKNWTATATPAATGPADADVMRDVGRHVRHGRARRGMTRRQLAAESGISERYLAQIETGQGNPSILSGESVAQSLARLLQVARLRAEPGGGG